MNRSIVPAAVVAVIALVQVDQGVVYAGALLGPYVQWHVTRVLYDWLLRQTGKPPRSYGKKILDGATSAEWFFEFGSLFGILCLPAVLIVVAIWAWS